MAWTTELGTSWTTQSSVSVGDPTKASFGNDTSGNARFSRDTKSSYLRGNCRDGNGDSCGNDAGAVIHVSGYVLDKEKYSLLVSSEYTKTEGLFDGDMRYRDITIIGAGYFESNAANGPEQVPGGAKEDNILPVNTHAQWDAPSLDGPILKFYSAAGRSDLTDDAHQMVRCTEDTYNASRFWIFVPDSSFDVAGSTGTLAQNDLGIYFSSTAGGGNFAFDFTIFISPQYTT